MLICGAVGVVGVGVGVVGVVGTGDAETETLAAAAVAGAVGEEPHAIDAEAATNAAPDVRPRECFLSLRTA